MLSCWSVTNILQSIAYCLFVSIFVKNNFYFQKFGKNKANYAENAIFIVKKNSICYYEELKAKIGLMQFKMLLTRTTLHQLKNSVGEVARKERRKWRQLDRATCHFLAKKKKKQLPQQLRLRGGGTLCLYGFT
jgi:hypothetical protein